jgi:hypothetical protein
VKADVDKLWEEWGRSYPQGGAQVFQRGAVESFSLIDQVVHKFSTFPQGLLVLLDQS